MSSRLVSEHLGLQTEYVSVANREQLLTDFYVKHSKSTCDLDKDTIEEFNRLQCRQVESIVSWT